MATKSMAYDHPAYLVPLPFSGSTTAGANGVSTKWAAFTAMKLKSVTLGINVASTSASQPLLYVKSGTATTTNTLTALTSAATTPLNNDLSSVAVIQGDQFWVTHGTDATAVLGVCVEAVVTPGAAVTN